MNPNERKLHKLPQIDSHVRLAHALAIRPAAKMERRRPPAATGWPTGRQTAPRRPRSGHGEPGDAGTRDPPGLGRRPRPPPHEGVAQRIPRGGRRRIRGQPKRGRSLDPRWLQLDAARPFNWTYPQVTIGRHGRPPPLPSLQRGSPHRGPFRYARGARPRPPAVWQDDARTAGRAKARLRVLQLRRRPDALVAEQAMVNQVRHLGQRLAANLGEAHR